MGAKVTEVVGAGIQFSVAATTEVAVSENVSLAVFAPDAPIDLDTSLEIAISEDVTAYLNPLPIDVSGSEEIAVSESISIFEALVNLLAATSETVAVSESVNIIRTLHVNTTQAIKVSESKAVLRSQTGTCSVELPMLEVEVEALYGNAAEVSNELPMFETSSTTLYGASGSMSENLPMFDVSATGTEHGTATVSAELPMFTVDSYGYSGEIGTADNELPMFELSATGIASETTGTVSEELPMFIVSATGETSVVVSSTDNVAMYSMNTQLAGVTEHASMDARGITSHNGTVYLANANGIWACDNSADDGEPVIVLLTRNGLDFGTSQLKTLTDCYSLVHSSGGHSVRVNSQFSKGTGTTSTVNANPHGSKVQLPRGVRGRLFDIDFFATEDNELELDEMELVAEISHTRRGRQNT